MTNKIFYIVLTLHANLISACETQQQRELILYSIGGGKVIYPLESPMHLPGENFNGYQLAKANPGMDLSELFSKVVLEFDFKHPHPLDIKLASRGKLGEFNCINLPTCTVRVRGSAQSGMIFIEVSGFFGRLRETNPSILPLVRFRKTELAWDYILPRIKEDIRTEGVTLEEYAKIVQEHAGADGVEFFSAYLRVDGCAGGVGCGETLEFCDNIYDAIYPLLEDLKRKAFFKVMDPECLLFYNSPQRFSEPRMCEKPTLGDSIMSILNNLGLVRTWKKHEEKEGLFKTVSDIFSVKLTESLYEVFCPIKKAFLDIKEEVLIFEIARGNYIGVQVHEFFSIFDEDSFKSFGNLVALEEGYDSEDLVKRINQREALILNEEPEELLPSELKQKRLFKALESIRPHVGKDKPHVRLLQFTLHDSSGSDVGFMQDTPCGCL